MKDEIGNTAGRIWSYLEQNGENPKGIIKIKLSLNIDNSLLFFALGWLEREDKITITASKNTYKVQLKKNET